MNQPSSKHLNLKEWREFRFLSQTELAAQSGVDNQTISRIETGKNKNPWPRTIKALAEALEVKPFELYRSPTEADR